MNLSPRTSGRLRHVCLATMTAALLSVVTVVGQYGHLQSGVRRRALCCSLRAESRWRRRSRWRRLRKRDPVRRRLEQSHRDGLQQRRPDGPEGRRSVECRGSASPVYGLVPHQLAAVAVNVDGTDRNAILISDQWSNRVAAFDTDGAHLFTLRLDPKLTQERIWQSIGMVAVSAGARFSLATSSQTLTLSGSFAAARVEQELTGEVISAALVFEGSATPIPLAGAEFIAAATTVSAWDRDRSRRARSDQHFRRCLRHAREPLRARCVHGTAARLRPRPPSLVHLRHARR